MVPEIIAARYLENMLSGQAEDKKAKETTAYNRRKDILSAAQKQEQMRREHPLPGETFKDLESATPDVLTKYLEFQGKNTPEMNSADVESKRAQADKNRADAWATRTYPPESAVKGNQEQAKLGLEGEKALLNAYNEAAKSGSSNDMFKAAYSALDPNYRAGLEKMNNLDPTSRDFSSYIDAVGKDLQDARSSGALSRVQAIQHWMRTSPTFQKYIQMKSHEGVPAQPKSSWSDPLTNFIYGAQGKQEG